LTESFFSESSAFSGFVRVESCLDEEEEGAAAMVRVVSIVASAKK
jgi:hypothetical protein